MSDLQFLAQFLYHSAPAEKRGALTVVQHNEAMALCDGYGQRSVAELRADGLTWDWSHVRDSSAEALAECRAYVERVLA